MMSIPHQSPEQKEEQDAHSLHDQPDIQPADETRFAPVLPASPQMHGAPPYYVRDDDDSDGQGPGGVSSSFIAPFQSSVEMPVITSEQDEMDRNISPPVPGSQRRRPSLLRIGLAAVIALLVLGALWITVFAQPAQPLVTVKSATPTVVHRPPSGTSGSTAHAGPTASPVLNPTATTFSPGSTQGASWIPQHLPTGWTDAGLTIGDGIFAERTAMTFTDREMGLDFRNVGTRGQHGGTFTAGTFILTMGGKTRFMQNDVRVVNNVLFDTVAATHLVQSVVNTTPNLMGFHVQGQQEFAWVDVSYMLFQSKIEPTTPDHRIEGLEMDPATGQPRVHRMSVLLVRVTPGTQGANAPMGGSGWLVSSYGVDVGGLLPITQPL